MAFRLSKLAELSGLEMRGEQDPEIDHVAAIEDADAGAICFVKGDSFIEALKQTSASAVITTEDLAQHSPVPVLVAENPRASYARVTEILYPRFQPDWGVHPTAVVADTARVSENAWIGAHVVIDDHAVIEDGVIIHPGAWVGHHSRIGRNTCIYANVSLYHEVTIGADCIIHAGTSIGSDGLGFEMDQGEWVKIPHVGGVVIGNRVEIGANTAIDRGSVKDTLIADDVKIDNEVHIAHNVSIGEHTIVTALVGIAGSTKIGKYCVFAGKSGVRDNIEITDNVVVTAMSMVSKSLTKPGSYSANTPIDDTATWRRNTARFRQLDELAKRLIKLEKKIDKL